MKPEPDSIKYLYTLNDLLLNLSKGTEDLDTSMNLIMSMMNKIIFEATLYKVKGLSVIDKRCVGYIKEMRQHKRPVSIDELENTSKKSSILLEVTNALDAIDRDLSEVLIQALS